MDIEPVEIDGKHWVTISVDGCELKRRGPFPSAVVARAMVDQLRELLEIPKDDVDVPSLIENHDFILAMARYSEGLQTEAQVKKQFRFTDDVWAKLGSDDALCQRIEETRIARVRSGAVKRERAQAEIIDGPPILGKIMRDPNANERHVIDSIKTLDALAANEPATAQNSSERFIITINLGNDEKLRFNKSIRPDPHDTDVEIIEPPQELLAIAAAKRKEGGGGQPI
jgi:hypothetical protein